MSLLVFALALVEVEARGVGDLRVQEAQRGRDQPGVVGGQLQLELASQDLRGRQVAEHGSGGADVEDLLVFPVVVEGGGVELHLAVEERRLDPDLAGVHELLGDGTLREGRGRRVQELHVVASRLEPVRVAAVDHGVRSQVHCRPALPPRWESLMSARTPARLVSFCGATRDEERVRAGREVRGQRAHEGVAVVGALRNARDVDRAAVIRGVLLLVPGVSAGRR